MPLPTTPRAARSADAPPLLRRHRDFRRLWFAESASFLGSQVTVVALPLTAAVLLRASPAEMGVLTAAAYLPYLLLALPLGVVVDRCAKRPLLVAADLGRAGLLATVPLLHVLDLLTMGLLIATTFGLGTLTLLYELTHQSYLPSVVAREDLVAANSTVTASRSTAELAGPGAAGVLVQLVTAPVALLVDVASFLLSATSLASIRVRESTPPSAPTRHAAREVREGLRATFGDPTLRAGAAAAATYNFWWNVVQAVLVLYVVRTLGVSAAAFGAVLSLGAAGSLAGALAAGPLLRRRGVGPTIVASAALACTSLLLLGAASSAAQAVVLLGVAFFLRGLGLAGWNVGIESLQQQIVPQTLLARMNGAYLLLSQGGGSIGGLVGGALGGALGLRPTIVVGTIGVAVAWLWLLLSPLRRLVAPVGAASAAAR